MILRLGRFPGSLNFQLEVLHVLSMNDRVIMAALRNGGRSGRPGSSCSSQDGRNGLHYVGQLTMHDVMNGMI